MSTTQPIRDRKELEQIRDYYYSTKPNMRNYALICLGINSTLRISDLLNLRWCDVYNFDTGTFRYHISIQEQKTGKQTRIALNQSAKEGLALYRESLDCCLEDNFIFPGKKGNSSHLSRSQAFRIIRNASRELHFENSVSCHSLRKTFGYFAWKNNTPPAVLMEIYNHSSYEITKRYLGIEQEDKDSVFFHINL